MRSRRRRLALLEMQNAISFTVDSIEQISGDVRAGFIRWSSAAGAACREDLFLTQTLILRCEEYRETTRSN
jgi:hypothetical protein